MPPSSARTDPAPPAILTSAPEAPAHTLLEDGAAIATGVLLVALGVAFFKQAGLLTGGITGLAFVLHYSTHTSLGLWLFVLNLPFYWLAVRKLRKVIDNVRRILAVEYVCAARAIDLRAPLQPSPATDALRQRLRAEVAGCGPDRYLAPELQAAEELLRVGALGDALADLGITLE